MRIKVVEEKRTHAYVICPKSGKLVKVDGKNSVCEGDNCVHFGGLFLPNVSCRYPEREENGTLHKFK